MVIKNTIPTHLKKNSIKHSEKWVIIVSIWTVLLLLLIIIIIIIIIIINRTNVAD